MDPPAPPPSEAADPRCSPLEQAGFLSFSTLSWMTPLMWSMSKGRLDVDSLRLPPPEGAAANGDRLMALWEQEVLCKGQEASLVRVLLRFQRRRLLLVLFIGLLFITCLFMGSGVLVHEILSFILRSEGGGSPGGGSPGGGSPGGGPPEGSPLWGSSLGGGVALCLCLVTVETLRLLCLTLSWALNLRTGLRLRAGFCMLGLHKILSLKTTIPAAQMLCVLTSDSYRVFEAVLLWSLVFPFPLLLLGCSVYCCFILGHTALIGFLLFLLFILLQLLFAWSISGFQQRAAAVTACRVRAISEVLSSIKAIKMFVWETAFKDRITDIRSSERSILEKAALLQNFSVTLSPLVPIMAAALTFITHTSLGLPLTTSTAYPVVTIFNCMRFILSMLPTAVKSLSEAAVSVGRLQRLLLLENPESYITTKTGCSSAAVTLKNACLSWTKPPPQNLSHPPHLSDPPPHLSDPPPHLSHLSDPPHPSHPPPEKQDGVSELQLTLKNISFTLNKGRLLGVCGNVGSGKTSLICSLLEQLYLHSGSVSVAGSVAVAPQQAWTFRGTLQQNILLGAPLDPPRYDSVLRSCSLNTDLHLLPHGDQTMLGEQGGGLSGGQRQRVGLARAVYADRDVYLLDDPLSALDVAVATHVFQHCIKHELQGKAVILVTHQLQFLEFCDEVLVLKDGMVLEAGPHLHLMERRGHYWELLSKHLLERKCQREEKKVEQRGHMDGGLVNPAFDMSDENTDATATTYTPADQLIDQEGTRSSLITWKTIGQYCEAAGGVCVCVPVLLLFLLLVLLSALSFWWLSFWLQHGHGTANVSWSRRGDVSVNIDLGFYQLVFAGVLLLVVAVCALKCFCYVKATLSASTELHNNLLDKVIHSPMSFFAGPAGGGVLNCFSRGQDEADAMVPHHLNALLLFSLIAVCVCSINAIIFPIMMLPILLLITAFSLLLRFFLRSVCELKRMENSSRSPCISLCCSMLQGLSTIQTYGRTQHYTQQFVELFDGNGHHLLLFHCSMRWLCFLVDFLCVAMTMPVALLVVFSPSDACSPPMKALALCYILQLTSNSQYLIQSLMEVQARFISVKGIQHYITSCPSESDGSPPVCVLPVGWPQHGAVSFLDLQMSYRPDAAAVLRRLRFHIRGGEKIGIVGRTGSGKSSLAVALFRLVEAAAGSIEIDGVDISCVPLTTLRSQLSIIPQEPAIFTGTVRFNLDPFGLHSDEEIWAALEKTHMKETICSLEGKLEAELTDGGGKFSVGEKQLLSLSRALLQPCKIVVLDEATASVDAETDALIQRTISEVFEGKTVLTITHRTDSVLQSDRLLVLSHGQVVEFDSPEVLKQRPDSAFSLLTAANTVVS